MPHGEITKPGIEDRADVEKLVNCFYEKVRKDSLIGPVFDDVARVDWDAHLPRLHAFWHAVLFGGGGFRGNPLGAHLKLVEETHMDWPRFERWLSLFGETVDELFSGDRAAHLTRIAEDMAHVIHSRINNIPDTRFDPANLTAGQKARYFRSRDTSKPIDQADL
jgi:hemoglobin